MRRWSILWLVCLASCLSHGTEGAKAESPIGPKPEVLAPEPAKPGVLDSKSSVDDVLDALQSSGKEVKSFSADVTDDELDQTFSTDVVRYGKVWFQTQPNGDATLHLNLDHKTMAGKSVPEKIEYLLEGGWLTIRNYDTKKQSRIQMAQPGQKTDLFQLGKGPFPLPIGQDKKDVHAQFDVTIPPPDKDDPKGTVHLLLTPKADTRLADDFFSIEVWVDYTTKMPVQITTENKRKSELKTWNLINLKVNPVIDKNDLALPGLEKGWNSVDKPLPK